MSTRPLVLALGLAALEACSPAPPPPPPAPLAGLRVSCAVDRAAYVVGDVAAVTVANGADAVVLFAPMCDVFVEGRHGGDWRVVYTPDCSRVRVAATRVAAGQSYTFEFRLEPNPLARHDGFRLRIRFQLEDGRTGVCRSTEFALAPL